MARGRLNIRPIMEADHRLHAGLLGSIPPAADAVALSYFSEPSVPDGVLVRIRHTGTYAMWRGWSLQQVDQRKAAAALEDERWTGPR